MHPPRRPDLREQRRFQTANADLTATSLRVNRIFALAMPVLMAILNLSSVAVLWFGRRLASEGTMPIGNLTAFLTYLMQILYGLRHEVEEKLARLPLRSWSRCAANSDRR